MLATFLLLISMPFSLSSDIFLLICLNSPGVLTVRGSCLFSLSFRKSWREWLIWILPRILELNFFDSMSVTLHDSAVKFSPNLSECLSDFLCVKAAIVFRMAFLLFCPLCCWRKKLDIAGAKPGIFLGRGVFLELGHFDKQSSIAQKIYPLFPPGDP